MKMMSSPKAIAILDFIDKGRVPIFRPEDIEIKAELIHTSSQKVSETGTHDPVSTDEPSVDTGRITPEATDAAPNPESEEDPGGISVVV